MDLAAIRLAEVAPINGLILTTDADSRVAPTWFAATLREFEKGVDCVAGYIDAIPAEYLALGGDFLDPRSPGRYLSSLSRRNQRAVRSEAARPLAEPPRIVRRKPSNHACGIFGNRRPAAAACRRRFGADRSS